MAPLAQVFAASHVTTKAHTEGIGGVVSKRDRAVSKRCCASYAADTGTARRPIILRKPISLPHFEVRRGKNNSCLGPELAGYGDLGGALLSARERTSARSRSMVERIFDQPEFRSEPNETMSG